MSERITPIDFDPFAGDFEDERTLSDKMVKARKPNTCFHCCGPIAVGEVHRARRGVVEDSGLMSWRWCAECCAAMIAEIEAEDGDSDETMPFEMRYGIHKAKNEEKS